MYICEWIKYSLDCGLGIKSWKSLQIVIIHSAVSSFLKVLKSINGKLLFLFQRNFEFWVVFLIYHPIITSPILSRGLELLCAPQIFNTSTSTIVNLYVVRNKLFPDPMALLETLRFLTFRKQIFQYSFLAQTDQFHYPRVLNWTFISFMNVRNFLWSSARLQPAIFI